MNPTAASRVVRLHRGQANGGFTIVELLIVMSIILVLAGLILATSGYVQAKGARSRAEAEIAAMSAAMESYKADNGTYPRGSATGAAVPSDTDKLDARTAGDPSAYALASLFLYEQLSGDADGDRKITGTETTNKSYLTFKPNQLSPTDQTAKVAFLRDPFGNSYGYSTAYQGDAEVQAATNPPGTVTKGSNPTFDLWSTGGTSSSSSTPDQSKWIKNW